MRIHIVDFFPCYPWISQCLLNAESDPRSWYGVNVDVGRKWYLGKKTEEQDKVECVFHLQDAAQSYGKHRMWSFHQEIQHILLHLFAEENSPRAESVEQLSISIKSTQLKKNNQQIHMKGINETVCSKP